MASGTYGAIWGKVLGFVGEFCPCICKILAETLLGWFAACMKPATVRAELSAGGLSNGSRCPYMLTLRHDGRTWRYVGKTGTSSKTGVSSPFKRLAKHLAKAGETQSCIWDSVCLPRRVLERGTIRFLALSIADDDKLKFGEDWLRWRTQGKSSLNKQRPPASEPEISAGLRARLRSVFKSEI